MAETLRTKILLLNGASGTWEQLGSHVLSKGEPAVEFVSGPNTETDSSIYTAVKVKVGDGVTSYQDLPYVGDELKAEYLSKFADLEAKLETVGSEVFQINGTDLAEVEGETEADKIASYLSSLDPAPVVKKGSIAIVKKAIADDKYSYTAYVYNGENWAAMDGNYDASNVYFDSDLTYTATIGALKLGSGKSSDVYAAKGKSLEEVIKRLLAETIAPTIQQPSYTLDSITANVGSSVEVGTNVTELKWNASFTDGTYSYKSVEAPSSNSAGCSATYSMSCDVAGTTTTPTAQDGTWKLTTPFQVTKTTAETVGTIDTTCVISDSPRTPVNNIGEEVDGKIKGKTVTGSKSFSVTGYRAWFCGYKNGTSAIKNPDTGAADATLITGDQIRALGNSANGSWVSSMDVSQLQQMFFAAPKGTGYKPSVADSKTTAPQTVLGPITVSVPGANGFTAIDYDVWYVNNTSAASGSATLTIGKA